VETSPAFSLKFSFFKKSKGYIVMAGKKTTKIKVVIVKNGKLKVEQRDLGK
jgi:hypothetical protein